MYQHHAVFSYTHGMGVTKHCSGKYSGPSVLRPPSGLWKVVLYFR